VPNEATVAKPAQNIVNDSLTIVYNVIEKDSVIQQC